MPPAQPKSLILDVYGGFVRRLGGWIAVADVISLLGDLGVDERAVRSAVSRMKRRGLLVQERQRGAVGYALSPEARVILEEGDRRIFAARQPADLAEGWVLATFSVPESERERRHVLRSRLTWLGFGNVAPGVWVAPRHRLDDASDLLGRLGLAGYVDLFSAHYEGFDDARRMVERCWDLVGLRALYGGFLTAQEPVLERWSGVEPAGSGGTTEPAGSGGRTKPAGSGGQAAPTDDRAAFVDYVFALDQWRRLPYLDPGLPTELLPEGWEGRGAADLFFALAERLEKPATRYVEEVVAR